MDYRGTLIAVQDMERSKAFYCGLFGMTVTADFGANVALSGGLYLQTAESWQGILQLPSEKIYFVGSASELYFETDDFDNFMDLLYEISDISFVHPPKEHPWGQRAVRFYDPDRHIIEVGEKMETVVHRFLSAGLSAEETAQRMDVPISYVEKIAEEDDAALLFSLLT
ncbi:MAG: VOC family protein [Oscillospiraceae bacterium]|nr:VOC family protein [Oscillospiraceae bacterium]